VRQLDRKLVIAGVMSLIGADVALTVRDGEAEMWMEEQRVTVSAGQSLIVPAERMHGFRNSGNVTLHIHAVLASPIFEATMEGATETVRRWEAV